jgi:hypothetical protein
MDEETRILIRDARHLFGNPKGGRRTSWEPEPEPEREREREQELEREPERERERERDEL